jgi:hypothetical protein
MSDTQTQTGRINLLDLDRAGMEARLGGPRAKRLPGLSGRGLPRGAPKPASVRTR